MQCIDIQKQIIRIIISHVFICKNLYGWVVPQKLRVGGFKWKKSIHKFHEYFIKNYDEDSDKRYILEYPKNVLNDHGHLPFLAKRKKNKKFSRLVCNINDKENNVVHIKTLKQSLNHGLILKKVHRVIQFN